MSLLFGDCCKQGQFVIGFYSTLDPCYTVYGVYIYNYGEKSIVPSSLLTSCGIATQEEKELKNNSTFKTGCR